MKHWDAPRAHEPLNTQVEIPGSKSQTARALYLAATGSSPCTIHGLLRSRDTDLFAEALVTLGAQISFIGEMSARVIPMEIRSATEEERQIDCGLAGTVLRSPLSPRALMATNKPMRALSAHFSTSSKLLGHASPITENTVTSPSPFRGLCATTPVRSPLTPRHLLSSFLQCS